MSARDRRRNRNERECERERERERCDEIKRIAPIRRRLRLVAERALRLEFAVFADARCVKSCEFAKSIKVALVKMRILILRSESESGVGRRARKYERKLREMCRSTTETKEDEDNG